MDASDRLRPAVGSTQALHGSNQSRRGRSQCRLTASVAAVPLVGVSEVQAGRPSYTVIRACPLASWGPPCPVIRGFVCALAIGAVDRLVKSLGGGAFLGVRCACPSNNAPAPRLMHSQHEMPPAPLQPLSKNHSQGQGGGVKCIKQRENVHAFNQRPFSTIRRVRNRSLWLLDARLLFSPGPGKLSIAGTFLVSETGRGRQRRGGGQNDTMRGGPRLPACEARFDRLMLQAIDS